VHGGSCPSSRCLMDGPYPAAEVQREGEAVRSGLSCQWPSLDLCSLLFNSDSRSPPQNVPERWR
jgi:hypothetical protein